jgi:hypothetical protein
MANAVVTVLEADGTTETDITILDVGRQAAAASKSVAASTEDKAVLDAIETAVEAIAATIVGGTNIQVQLDPSTVNANGRASEADSAPLALDLEAFTALQAIETATESAVGGLSVFRSLDLDESSEQVKASAGKLWKLRIANRSTSVVYVKLFNHASPSVGSTTPIDTIVVPAAAASDACVITETFGGKGLSFSTALSLACTTGLADSESTGPSANDVVVSAYYE